MQRRKIYFFVVVFIFVAMAGLLSYHSSIVLAESTATIKVCHMCETVGVESTPTATPISCGHYCKERDPETPVLNPTDGTGKVEYEAGIVKALFFWAEGCPNCVEVKAFTLPKLEKLYGEKLQIKQVELKSMDEIGPLFIVGARMGLGGDQIGLPFLIIGENILVGSSEIPEKLPALIESYLAQGGVGYLDDPYLADYLMASAPTPTPVTEEVGSSSAVSPKIIITLFWGDGCPHCAEAKPFLQNLAQSSGQVELRMYEVWSSEENQALFTKMANAYGFEPYGVPTIFIGSRYWEGYNELIRTEIQAAVETCLVDGCPQTDGGIVTGSAGDDNSPFTSGLDEEAVPPGGKSIILPLIGTLDLSSQPLLVSTLLISLVDGFNPCSIWVLTMLLALTLHTGSRKKVLLIGFIFLTVTAAVYGLFITGMFTMFKVVSFVGWVQAVVVLAALFFALVNIKDYFWYKEGVSFTISDEKKPGIFKRIRRIMDSGDSFWGLVGGTIVLAVGVSLVEFSCTAGFPVLWSNLLVSQEVPVLTFVVLLLVYLLVYQLDEMGIFLFAVLTMRASKMEEKHGRILKLVGGMLMLTLALVMLINPNLMNDLSNSLIIFGAAFGATLIILFVHRVVLPRFGIQIGSENNQ